MVSKSKKKKKKKIKKQKKASKALKKRNNQRKGRNKFSQNKFLKTNSSLNTLIFSTISFIIGVILIFSFFDKAGPAGNAFKNLSLFLFAKLTYLLPFVFFGISIFYFLKRIEKKNLAIISTFIVFLALTAIFSTGKVGVFFAKPIEKYFGQILKNLIWITVLFVGILFFHQSLSKEKEQVEKIEIPRKVQPKIIPERKPLKRKISLKVFSFHKNKEKEKEKQKEKKAVLPKKVLLPPINLLEETKEPPLSGDIKKNSEIIKNTLQNFGIICEVTEVHIGPTVTQYCIKPAPGIKLSKITTLSNNLALALASHPIRIEAPIPGKSLVGIEVPNKRRSRVRLKELISSKDFQKSKNSLLFPLGRDVAGFEIYDDLTRAPHLLVAGATGTGKTMFLNNLILSLIFRNSPQDLRFLLIDPKRVEFSVYQDLPHLLCPVIHDVQKTIATLTWITKEMERRFKILAKSGTRDIFSYNRKFPDEKIPFIILIIDELADLMAARPREMEAGIVRLAQLARAVGIHLVLATQRPSVEVITGLIKANITSRIAFQVASQVDSRTILDTSGAEKLLGKGDLLFISARFAKPKRAQAPFVSEKEVREVVNFLAKNYSFELDSNILDIKNSLKEALDKEQETFIGGEFLAEDPLYERAKQLVIEAQKASASLLQRRLRIGYARAARILDMLEERGIIGPADGAKPREVYQKRENNFEQNNDGEFERDNDI